MPRDRIRHPPSSITGELGEYLREIHAEIVNRPRMSYFSGTDPNSSVTGLAGDTTMSIAISATTRFWLKQGSALTPGRSSWTGIR